MKKEIEQRHRNEWTSFEIERHEALKQYKSDEEFNRHLSKSYGFEFSKEWEEKTERERKKFETEWGEDGLRKQLIDVRQKLEVEKNKHFYSEEEINDMYEEHLKSEEQIIDDEVSEEEAYNGRRFLQSILKHNEKRQLGYKPKM